MGWHLAHMRWVKLTSPVTILPPRLFNMCNIQLGRMVVRLHKEEVLMEHTQRMSRSHKAGMWMLRAINSFFKEIFPIISAAFMGVRHDYFHFIPVWLLVFPLPSCFFPLLAFSSHLGYHFHPRLSNATWAGQAKVWVGLLQFCGSTSLT